MLNKKSNTVAYEGKRVKYNNNTYILIPEVIRDSCTDCIFYNTHCTSKLTDNCLRGYIYRKE